MSHETPAVLLDRVIAHEMLHTAGMVEHESSPQCFLYQNAFPGQSNIPCGPEVDRLREIEHTITISVPDPELVEPSRECAAMWNEVAGREVFVIVDATPPAPEAIR
ncbi:MAG: hypothetical protein QNJ98_17880 [Planctomycetota bacterium]|nr:hypothetical protein [Planctomycetota bacterium]